MKKIISAALCVLVLFSCIVTASAESKIGNYFRFVPTEIEVLEDKVTVYGYFVNLNEDETISNLTDYEMEVYKGGDLLVEGSFGEIHKFSVKPKGVQYQSFTFNGDHDLKVGSYTCNDTFYTVVKCSFSYST